MRKVIETNDTQILALCDDLERYGRKATLENRCKDCPILKHPERVVENKELHCYGPIMMKAKIAEAKMQGYRRRFM